jgi:hypothetical protein
MKPFAYPKRTIKTTNSVFKGHIIQYYSIFEENMKRLPTNAVKIVLIICLELEKCVRGLLVAFWD